MTIDLGEVQASAPVQNANNNQANGAQGDNNEQR